MMDIAKMVQAEIALGYSDLNARAKVCQDIVLKAIAAGPLSRNVTIKGGVVMRSKTKNVRRATQDLDIDFLRYPLTDSAIDTFIASMGRLEGITIKRFGSIEELRPQEYKGKRVHIEIADSNGNKIQSKIDLGVHSRLDIDQEMFCFDIALDSEGASLLINSSEQMFAEKLRSLLKFGKYFRGKLYDDSGSKNPVAVLSKTAREKISHLNDLGYSVKQVRIRYVVAWRNKEREDLCPIILPEIELVKK